jgi:hypothetical protein
MPFAFCTSYDLIEKVAVLEELDAYLWLARYHFKQSKTDLPVAFRQKYHLWLEQFSEQMVQVKQIQLVQYIFTVNSGDELALDGTHPSILIQEETISVTQEKVLRSIQHVAALSSTEQGHTVALASAAQYYLEQNPQHIGYTGDNVSYLTHTS